MADNGMGVAMAESPIVGQVARPAPESVLRIALDVLSVRAERFVTLAMNFTLFGAAVWWPDRWRLAGASGFALVVIVLTWFRKEK